LYEPTKKTLDKIDVSNIEFTDKDLKEWIKKNFDDKKYELV